VAIDPSSAGVATWPRLLTDAPRGAVHIHAVLSWRPRSGLTQGDSTLRREWNGSNGGRPLVKKLWVGKLHPRVPAVMIFILTTIRALKQKNYDAVLADGRIRGSYRTNDVVPVPEGI